MSLIDQIKRNKLFRDTGILKLTKEFVNKKPVVYEKNQLIYGKGSPSNFVYLVIEGKVNIIDYNFVNLSKRQSLSKTIITNDFFGYEEIISNVNRLSTCVSLSETIVLPISRKELQKLIADNPQVENNLFESPPEQEEVLQKRTSKTSGQVRNFTATFDFKGKRSDDQVIKEHPPEKETDKHLKSPPINTNREKPEIEGPEQESNTELSKREQELKRFEDSLKKEKEFAELELNKEFHELSKREKQIEQLEEALLQEEAQAQALIKKKILELKKQEDELKNRNKTLQNEKQLVENTLNKAKELAARELELLKQANELKKEKENATKITSKEKELEAKERALENKFAELNKAKTALDIAVKKEEELKEKEKTIEAKFKLLEEEKQKVEESLLKEKELEQKENELKEKYEQLESEKIKVEQILDKEEELAKKELEIETRLKQIEEETEKGAKTVREMEQIKIKEEELHSRLEEVEKEKDIIRAAKLKEDELYKKENELSLLSESLAKEKQMSEEAITQEIANLEKREQEINEREKNLELEKQFAEQALEQRLNDIERLEASLLEQRNKLIKDASDTKSETNKELEAFKEREAQLLKRIQDLESKSAENEAATAAPPDPEPQIEIVEPEIKPDTIKEQGIATNPEPPDQIQMEPEIIEEKPANGNNELSELEKEIESGIDFTYKYQKFEHNDIDIVTVNIDRATANTAPEFKNYLERLINRGTKKLIIDIGRCEFMDSTFLGVLVKYLKKISYEGGSLKVVLNKDNSPSTMFFISGMDRVLKTFNSISDAVSDFQ